MSVTVTVAMGAGGVAVTVNVVLPDFPSLVAMMFAVPTAIDVTAPVADTRAIVVSLEPHVTTRPLSVFPFASCSVALAWVPEPATTDAAANETLTVATGAGAASAIETGTDSVMPPVDAVTVALPALRAVTIPADETRAIVVSLLAQVIAMPESGFEELSRATALSASESPVVSDTVDGVI